MDHVFSSTERHRHICRVFQSSPSRRLVKLLLGFFCSAPTRQPLVIGITSEAMHFSLALLSASVAVTAVCAVVPPTQNDAWHRETVQEAAYHARDLITSRSDGLATFMSVFPEGYGDGLDGIPIGGMEYVAPADDGDLYILAMPLSKVRYSYEF